MRRDADTLNAVITILWIYLEHIRYRNSFAAEILSFLGVLERQHIPRYLLNNMRKFS